MKSIFQGPEETLKGLIILLALITLSSCGDEPFEIPDPPSFNWKASIYQNPATISEVNEPSCDIKPPLNGADPPFDGYYYYHTSPDPVVWKIKLNKSRRDLVAYISYVPDLKAPQQEQAGHYTLSIKDLISGEVTLVDEMWHNYHLGFDFAGDYLIYERNFEGYLYNWKTGAKKKLGNGVDYPSLSLNAHLMSFQDDIQKRMVVVDIESSYNVFSLNSSKSNVSGINLLWISDSIAYTTRDFSNLVKLNVYVDDSFEHYVGPFDWGIGFIVGLSSDNAFIYGNSYGVSNLNTLKVNVLWRTALPKDCGNRDLANFFILPDNTFMMRKTYFISDHDKRRVYPEYHWHLFDADGSNERRVDLQL